MNPIILILAAIVIVGIIAFFTAVYIRRIIAVPSGNVVYADSEHEAGDVLRSSQIPLVGKPDYILERDGVHIPVEVKMGKTPRDPYKNHIAQLFAYCFLLEEKYHKRPPYGIIRYPDREVPLEYAAGAENGLKAIISEILQKKSSGKIRDNIGQICRKCSVGEHGKTTSSM